MNPLKSTTHSLPFLDSVAATKPQFLFREIRKLGLSEYSLLLHNQPLEQCPNLSQELTKPTSVELQKLFTGGHGHELLIRSIDFVRHFRTQLYTHSHPGMAHLSNAQILDYGCGWGRLLRLMYFYFDRDQLVGVDSWEKAIDACNAAGLGPSVYLIDRAGKSVADLKMFDAAYAFSVFTHLPSGLLKEIMRNIHACVKPGGIFLITVRPPEYWEFRISHAANTSKGNDAHVTRWKAALDAHYECGHAFIGSGGNDAETFGESSFDLGWLERNLPQWEILEQDRSLNDPLQLCVTLRARNTRDAQ